jgi:hypothetical protein
MAAGHSTAKFYGWSVVAAVFVLATFGWGLGFYGPPVFLHTVQVARGWSLALISAAVTTHFLFGALVVANLPKLYKRISAHAATRISSWIGAGKGLIWSTLIGCLTISEMSRSPRKSRHPFSKAWKPACVLPRPQNRSPRHSALLRHDRLRQLLSHSVTSRYRFQ